MSYLNLKVYAKLDKDLSILDRHALVALSTKIL